MGHMMNYCDMALNKLFKGKSIFPEDCRDLLV